LPSLETVDDVAFNVGTGVETSVNDLARTLLDITESDVEITHAAARAGELLRSAVDPSKLTAAWDWRPQIGLADGLKRTYDWIASDQ
jgi:UDP-glucose 4-epimerase